MTEPSEADLRTRLRTETADAHRALEEELDLMRRLSDREAIVRVLCGLRGFVGPAEAALDHALGLDVMAGRHRVSALDADLRALGLDWPAIDRLPLCPAAGRARSRATALGALYVLEGARLGGRLIGAALARESWVPTGFSRFWSVQPNADGQWRRFLALLPGEPDGDAVVDGAVETFEALRAWLVPTGHGAPWPVGMP